MDPLTLTIKKATAYSGLSADKLRGLVNSNQVSTLDRGPDGRGHIHIIRESLDEWIAAHSSKAITPEPSRPVFDADSGITFDGPSIFT